MFRFVPHYASFIAAALVLALLTSGERTCAFVVQPRTPIPTNANTPLHLFNKLGDAFKNDDSLGDRENAGLKKGPAYNDNVSINGKPVQGAVVGQKLTVVAGRARVKIPVNCQQGDCGTCIVMLNGRKVKGTILS